jgi:hypothetical protein
MRLSYYSRLVEKGKFVHAYIQHLFLFFSLAEPFIATSFILEICISTSTKSHSQFIEKSRIGAQ